MFAFLNSDSVEPEFPREFWSHSLCFAGYPLLPVLGEGSTVPPRAVSKCRSSKLFIQRHHSHSPKMNSNHEKVTTAEGSCLLGHKGDKLDNSRSIHQCSWFDREITDSKCQLAVQRHTECSDRDKITKTAWEFNLLFFYKLKWIYFSFLRECRLLLCIFCSPLQRRHPFSRLLSLLKWCL